MLAENMNIAVVGNAALRILVDRCHVLWEHVAPSSGQLHTKRAFIYRKIENRQEKFFEFGRGSRIS